MSIMDTHVTVGLESTYATAVTPDTSFEAKVDDWELENQYLESVGFRANLQGVRGDRVNTIPMGGTGSIQLDFLDKGMGTLLQAAGASVTGPTQEESTAAYTTTVEATDAAPNKSFTIQIARPDVEGTVVPFTHAGAAVTGWTINQAMDAMLEVVFNFDFATLTTQTSEATPSYVAGSSVYDWSQAAITLDSVAVDDVMSLSAEVNHAVKTNRRYLRNSSTKKQPVRNGVPEVTGSMNADFVSGGFYPEFVSGAILDDLVFTWTGSTIEGAYDHTFSIAFPKVQWRGETPKVSYTDTPTQNVPFKVLWSGEDALFTVTYTSTDTSL